MKRRGILVVVGVKDRRKAERYREAAPRHRHTLIIVGKDSLCLEGVVIDRIDMLPQDVLCLIFLWCIVSPSFEFGWLLRIDA